MNKCLLWFALSITLLAGCACSRDLVPDSVLEGLHKPVITRLLPGRVQFNDSGLHLGVWLKTEDRQYVLYLNDRQVGTANPGYWGGSVGYKISKELLNELIASSSDSATLNVRVTGISGDYDISGDFDRYGDYVSEPFPLRVERGKTQFSQARLLFPEWTLSSEPLIRCDSRGAVYLAWLETLVNYNQLFFSFSADGGQTWSQVLNISRSNWGVHAPDLAVDGAGHFYMAWMAFAGQIPEVFFSRSTDNGATWHLPVRASLEGADAEWPVLAVDERGTLFLAWMQSPAGGGYELLLASSPDMGATWSRRTFPVTAVLHNWKPLLAARPGGRMDLFLAGRDNAGLSVKIHSSLDFGRTWKERTVTAGDCYLSAENPQVRFGEGEQLSLFWSGVSYTGHYFSLWNYLLSRSVSGEWSPLQDLKDSCPSSGSKFSILPLGERTDAILDNGGCLYLLRSIDEGRTWSVPETVAGADGEYVTHAPDAVRHPSGKTYVVFVRKSAAGDCCLHLTSFE